MLAPSLAELLTAIVLWTITAWWWWRRRPGQVWLCVAMTAFSCTATIRMAVVYAALDEAMGIPVGATLAIQVAQVVILAAMWEGLAARLSTDRRSVAKRLRLIAVGVTLVSMTAVFLIGYYTSPELWPSSDMELRFATSPGSLATFLWIYGIYDGVALGVCTLLTARQMRLARQWPARVAFGLTSIAYGAAFVVHTVTMLVVARVLDLDHEFVQQVDGAVLTGGFLLVVIGMCTPAFSAFVARRTAPLRERRAYRRLEPLWRRLSEAIPEIVLMPPQSLPDPWTQLYRRMIETWDGIRAVTPWVSAELDEGARKSCPWYRRWPRRRGEVAVVAICIEAALQVKSSGRGAAGTPDQPSRLTATGTFTDELDWLVAVATAWTCQPIQRAAARLASPPAHPTRAVEHEKGELS
jgi:hypothetical protein